MDNTASPCFSFDLRYYLISMNTNNVLHSSVTKIFFCTLWGLALAKKPGNNIKNSPAQVSRLYFFLLFWLIYCKIHLFYLPIFYLVCGLIHLKNFWEALITVIPFLSFKGTIHAYLLKVSLTHNKKRIVLLNYLLFPYWQDQNPKYYKEFTVGFSNFLITGLCNSSANSWLDIISLLTAPRELLTLEDFLSKYL